MALAPKLKESCSCRKMSAELGHTAEEAYESKYDDCACREYARSWQSSGQRTESGGLTPERLEFAGENSEEDLERFSKRLRQREKVRAHGLRTGSRRIESTCARRLQSLSSAQATERGKRTFDGEHGLYNQ